jgi:alpha-D-ribose 1-methylphosphonate 5-triphosphate diphosphatase PhnM
VIVRIDPARAYLCAGDAAHSATDLVTAAPLVAEWCKREGITVLTSHDDSASRRIAESPTMDASRHDGSADDAATLK